MFDYQTMRLMHLHGDERFPMIERDHADAADHDPERGWTHGSRIFRCTRCNEEVAMLPPGRDEADGEPA